MELMIVVVIAIALRRFQIPAVHQQAGVEVNTLPSCGDMAENLLKLIAVLIVSAAAPTALWTAN